MRRKRSRKTSMKTDEPNMSTDGGVRSASLHPLVDSARGDTLDAIPLGYSNLNRSFIYSNSAALNEGRTTPFAVFRAVTPYAATILGWASAKSESNDGDWASLLDTEAATEASIFYPITPSAHIWQDNVWPVLSNLVQSGLGARAITLSSSSTMSYMAKLIASYQVIEYALNINHLAYNFDWSQVYPYTEQAPPWIYTLAANLDVTNVGVADLWAPLMERMETKIMFPRHVNEVKRMMAPMLAPDMQARIIIPCIRLPFINATAHEWGEPRLGTGAADGAQLRAAVTNWLDFVDVALAKTSAVIRTFLPFSLVETDPWRRPPLEIDMQRYEGMWNSGIRAPTTDDLGPFGDTGDPAEDDDFWFEGTRSITTVGEFFKVPFSSWSRRPSYNAFSPMPTWGSVRLSTVWAVAGITADDVYGLLTEHLYSAIFFIDDDSSSVEWTEADTAARVEFVRYRRFLDSKYAGSILAEGADRSDMLYASIEPDAIWRNVRLQVESDWSLAALTYVAIQAAGASLREVRTSIAQLASLKA